MQWQCTNVRNRMDRLGCIVTLPEKGEWQYGGGREGEEGRRRERKGGDWVLFYMYGKVTIIEIIE